MKKFPPMVVTPCDRTKKPKIKPLCSEMAVRHKRALQRLLDDGDISKAQYDALWAKTLERVKAGV
jgi:hypothetical protein